MHLLATSTLAWIGFCIFILAMLAIDLGVFNRRPHEITFKNAAVWSVVWITLALIFAALLFHPLGLELFGPARHQKGLEFLTGYLIELALSIDNLFIFLLIFSYFKVPPKYQHRVLYWGVLGALVMRITMIFLGTELIQHFHWVIYLFGAFLVYTAVRMVRAEEVSIEPDENVIVRFVTRYVPISRPILGLRTFYFMLASVVERFHYLKFGLGLVLGFIGVKMLLPLITKLLAAGLQSLGYDALVPRIMSFKDIPIIVALGVVALVLLTSIVASLIWPKQEVR